MKYASTSTSAELPYLKELIFKPSPVEPDD